MRLMPKHVSKWFLPLYIKISNVHYAEQCLLQEMHCYNAHCLLSITMPYFTVISAAISALFNSYLECRAPLAMLLGDYIAVAVTTLYSERVL